MAGQALKEIHLSKDIGSNHDSEIGAEDDASHAVGKDAATEVNHLHFPLSTASKVILWIALSAMWTVFEFDNATVYTFQNYAVSEFAQISSLGAITAAGTIVSAVMKPPVAKLSDVLGRAEAYSIAVILYIVAYAMTASSSSFGIYAAGYIIYCLGQTSMQVLNQILVADLTSSRFRGLANQLVSLPFMIVPWISAFIAESALQSIGWRWGIGVFAIILPLCSLTLIIPILLFQSRARKEASIPYRVKLDRGFWSRIDVIGMVLLTAAFACILLPLSLAGSAPQRWETAWIPSLIAIGIVLLCICCFYEAKFADHPIFPARYVKMTPIVLACTIGLMDALAYSTTHTYLYPWATIVHSFSPREATFLTYTAACTQILIGLVTGYIMWRTRRLKYILIAGIVIRCIGYGVMIRLRGANNALGELFVVQIIQGIGSGIVQTIVLVIAQVVVPHVELAQATALLLLFVYLGNAIGSAIAGSIYTNSFDNRLAVHLNESVAPDILSGIINTLDAVSDPLLKAAVNLAYSDVVRYMAIAGLVASVIPLVVVGFLPDIHLSEKHNISDEELPKSIMRARLVRSWRGGRRMSKH